LHRRGIEIIHAIGHASTMRSGAMRPRATPDR
jgi:hypothetical protein